MSIDTKSIYKLASKFRYAIETTDKSKFPVGMKTFPHGACGDSTLLLAKYLQECGYDFFEYILGTNDDINNFCTHAWLEHNGIIVDITADQFDIGMPRVYVGSISLWHASFPSRESTSSDFNDYLGIMLLPAYRLIINNIESC